MKFDWRNRQTIRGGDGSGWLDSNVTDGTQIFKRQGQTVTGRGCSTDQLDVKTKQGATQATLTWYTAPSPTDPSQQCRSNSQTVQIGSKENYYKTYNWIDSGLIRHFQGEDLGDSQRLREVNGLEVPEYQNFARKGSIAGWDRYMQQGDVACPSYIDVKPSNPLTGSFTYNLSDQFGTCFVSYTIEIPLAQEDNYKLEAGAGPGNSNDGNAAPKASCETENADDVFGWSICGALHGMDKVIHDVDGLIQGLLIIPMKYFEGNFVQAWGTIRNLALLVLVPIMLIMVIATALEIGPFDAYTVRKTLPRFLLAVLFIVLSLPILKFLVQLSNVVETGTLGLISAAFNNDVQNITLESLFNPDAKDTVVAGASGLVGVMGVFGAIAAGGVTLGVVFSFALVAVVGVAIGLLVLMIRVLLVVGLVLLAPVAILTWIFPGNDKLWKMWKNTLIPLLLLGPILGAFIGVARMLASLDATPWWLKIFFYVGVYFLILTIIKSFGGLLTTVMNGLDNKAKGFFDGQRKFRAGSRQKAWGKFRAGERGYFNSVKKAGFTTGAFLDAEKKGSFVGSALLNSGRMVRKRPKTGYYAEAVSQQHKLNESRYSQTDRAKATQEDDYMLQALTYRNAAEAQARMGADFGVAPDQVRRAIAAANTTGGFSAARQNYATRQLVRTGTGYRNVEDMHRTVARVAGNNRSMAADMLGEMNAQTKGVGRHDLATGYGMQMDLYDRVQNDGGYDALVATGNPGAAILTDDEQRRAHLQAAKDIDAVTLLRDKKKGVENMSRAIEQSFTVAQNAAAAARGRMNDPTLSPELQAHAENEYRTQMEEVGRLGGYMGKMEQSGTYASVTNVDAAYDGALSSTSGVGRTRDETIAHGQIIRVPTDGRQGVNAAASSTQIQVHPTTGRLENVPMTRIDPATGRLVPLVDPITGHVIYAPNPERSAEAAEQVRRHGVSGQGTNPNDPNYT